MRVRFWFKVKTRHTQFLIGVEILVPQLWFPSVKIAPNSRALVIVPIPVVLVAEELEVQPAEMVEAAGVAFF
jgi:hypothetical protein